MIHHITFTDHNMTISAEKCKASAEKFGCDSSKIYTPKDIRPIFYNQNKAVLSQERGAGYWLWKPYFIQQRLATMKDGEILVYTDAGVEFVSNVQQLIDEMEGDIMVFGNGHRHGDWCKGDVLVHMGADEYVDHDQVQASCVIIRKSKYIFAFIDEWIEWACQKGFIDDTPSFYANEPTFKEHRHDQAILTNLAIREGIKFNRWPAQYALRGNEKYNNKYGQVFNHHGLRNNGKRTNE